MASYVHLSEKELTLLEELARNAGDKTLAGKLKWARETALSYKE